MSKLYDCEKLCVCCYRHLLDDVFKYERIRSYDMTVQEFADTYPVGIFLVRMGGHISTIIDNNVYDIFDCRREVVTDAWQVK